MSDETQDLDGMLGFLAGDDRFQRDPEEHPGPEELSAYQANELSPEQDARIQDHLAVCGQCTELLLDLEELLEPPVAAPAADFEAAADWRRLRESLPLATVKPEPPRAKVSEQRDYRPMRSLQVYRALAAVLGLMVIGLSLYAVRPREPEIFSLQEPVYFGTTRGTAEPPLKIRLPFSLGYSTAPAYPKYRVEILDSDGNPRYSRDTTLPDGSIPLHAGFLPPGAYGLRLSGLENGTWTTIGKPLKLIVQP